MLGLLHEGKLNVLIVLGLGVLINYNVTSVSIMTRTCVVRVIFRVEVMVEH